MGKKVAAFGDPPLVALKRSCTLLSFYITESRAEHSAMGKESCQLWEIVLKPWVRAFRYNQAIRKRPLLYHINSALFLYCCFHLFALSQYCRQEAQIVNAIYTEVISEAIHAHSLSSMPVRFRIS